MEPNPTCPSCHLQVLPVFYFCPNCGTNLRPKPLPTTAIKQISIYLISAFLPPLGLWPAVKYLREKDKKSKRVGWIAIWLTIISVLISAYLAVGFGNYINKQVQSQLQSSQLP